MTSHTSDELLGRELGDGDFTPEPPPGTEQSEVRARSYWEQVWRRFRRDRVAIASVVFLSCSSWSCTRAPGSRSACSGTGRTRSSRTRSTTVSCRSGPMSTVTNFETGEKQLLILGADGTLGRDEFLRLLYGGRVSLQVAHHLDVPRDDDRRDARRRGGLLPWLGRHDRGAVTEITMAFPVLLFAVALASTAGSRMNSITFGGLLGEGVVTLVLIFTLFGWFYPARIIRAKVFSLREKEFIEAALMTGASDTRIIRSHLLPHLVAPIIVYSSLIVASFILFEAALSFVGGRDPAAHRELGEPPRRGAELLHDGSLLMLWPGIAVILTTLAFNLLGDGLRDAFDPRSRL